MFIDYSINSDYVFGNVLLEQEHSVIVPHQYKIMTPISEGGVNELRAIEESSRICYNSKIGDFEACKSHIKRLKDSGHTAMFEHSYLKVRFITDRAIANEIARHRHCGFAQQSTRYCNFAHPKYGGKVAFANQYMLNNLDGSFTKPDWYDSVDRDAALYLDMVNRGVKPELARGILPLSLATVIDVSASYREWMSIIELRTASGAHPYIRMLMDAVHKELRQAIPIIFD